MSVTTISPDQWIEDARHEVGALEIHPCRAEEIREAVVRRYCRSGQGRLPTALGGRKTATTSSKSDLLYEVKS
jgi:hypothetical protein